MPDVLFVVPTEELKVSREANGIMLLGSILLQEGFDVDILRFGQVDQFLHDYPAFIKVATEKILSARPKCVSFYTLWPYYHTSLRIAKEVKQLAPDIITVLGGPQSSATADATITSMDFIDYICTGEGEKTVGPFFNALLSNGGEGLDSIPGLYYRINGSIHFNNSDIPFCDLNTLPHWDDRLYLAQYDETQQLWASDQYFMPIDAGRGCPYSCTFCCTSYFWRRTYRLKSPERIIEDIRYYHDKFGIKSFWFSHDAFTTNKALVSEVCDRILEEGLDIRWKCTARIDCITEELVQKMIQAGLVAIELGIETGSLRMQKLVNKNLNLDRARRMISYLLEQKLFVGLFFMYGFPEETEQDLNETLELLFDLIDLGVNYTSMSFCRFNPATEITNQHFDDLVLDPSVNILSRSVFGYEEELEMIRNNKALFPYFYHLNTPVRNRYQYLFYLQRLYRCFPKTIRFVRTLYKGDNLKLYRDFYENNQASFADTASLSERLESDPFPLLNNTLNGLSTSTPNLAQLRALAKFEADSWRVRRSEDDISVQETYNFNFLDFKMNLPIEQYTAGQTTFLMQKKKGVFGIKILNIQ